MNTLCIVRRSILHILNPNFQAYIQNVSMFPHISTLKFIKNYT